MDNSDWLKLSVDKIESKVDVLDTKIDTLNERHIKNTAVLDEHIYRTKLNEENINMLREQVKPIENHILMLQGAIKLVGYIAVVFGVLASLVKILYYLLHLS
jgi:hypothetical protein